MASLERGYPHRFVKSQDYYVTHHLEIFLPFVNSLGDWRDLVHVFTIHTSLSLRQTLQETNQYFGSHIRIMYRDGFFMMMADPTFTTYEEHSHRA